MKITPDGRQALWPEPEVRHRFETGLRPGLSREWESLAAEKDPDLLASTALNLAAKLQAEEQPEKAAFLLSGLSEASDLDPALREKIQERWAALQGKGEMGAQVESLLSQLTREARRPWPMMAMGAASACFSISRLALLARWRGALSSLATPLATVGEAAAFTAALPLLEKISPHPGGMAWRGYGTEFLSSLFLMSALKLSAGPLRSTSPLLRFSGLYGALLFTHGAERRFGLRPEIPASAAFIEGLALALQLEAGAGLTKAIFGPRNLRAIGEAELRSRVIPSAVEGPHSDQGGMRSFAPLRMTPLTATTAPKQASPLSDIYAMSQHGSRSSRPPLRLVSADPREEFAHTYGKNQAFQAACQRIMLRYGPKHDATKLGLLLIDSGVHHPRVLIPGLRKLADILRGDLGETAMPYRDWLVKRIYERIYFEDRSPLALGEILRSLAADEGFADLEQGLAAHFGEMNLRAPKPMTTPKNSLNFQLEATKRLYDWREFERQTSNLPLDEAARRVLFDWKNSQRSSHHGNMHSQIDRFLDLLYDLGQGPHAARVLDVNAAIAAAGSSPLGLARLARLDSLLLASRDHPPAALLQELR